MEEEDILKKILIKKINKLELINNLDYTLSEKMDYLQKSALLLTREEIENNDIDHNFELVKLREYIKYIYNNIK